MKISLITACYNSAKTIKTAIDSVLSQKGVDIEYIIVDGGSKDGTVDIIKEYSTRSTRLNDVNSSLHVSTCSTRLTFKWISEKDRGMYDAINKGIKMATGDVVGILNADDVLAFQCRDQPRGPSRPSFPRRLVVPPAHLSEVLLQDLGICVQEELIGS